MGYANGSCGSSCTKERKVMSINGSKLINLCQIEKHSITQKFNNIKAIAGHETLKESFEPFVMRRFAVRPRTSVPMKN
jgi:hypothetical protein